MKTPLFSLDHAELTSKLEFLIADAQALKNELNKLHKNAVLVLDVIANEYDLKSAIALYKSLVTTSPVVEEYIRDMYLEALDEALQITTLVLTASGDVNVILTLKAVSRTLCRQCVPELLRKEYPAIALLEDFAS